MKQKIVLIGGGGHCKVCVDVIEQEGVFEIAGIIDKKRGGAGVMGYPLIGTDGDIPEICQQFEWYLIAMGQIMSSQLRFDLFNTIEISGGRFPVIVSPWAYCSLRAHIGKGTIVMHKAVVNAGSEIGENCIINTGAIIEHDVKTGAHNHISTGTIINGGVCIGNHTFVGSGSVIKEEVKIGDHVIIGAGACILKDVPVGTVVKGSYY